MSADLSHVERRLAALADVTHRNYRPKSEEFAEFVGNLGDEPATLDALLACARTASNLKTTFLAAVAGSLRFGLAASDLWHTVQSRLGDEYLVALALHLGILRKTLNSPRGGALVERAGAKRPVMIENTRRAEAQVRELARSTGTLDRFLDGFLDVAPRPASRGERLSIGIVLDDLNPLPTATLSKMVFDQIAVLLQHTPHSITILVSRLHAPGDEFWTPGVHQTRMLPLRDYMERYDIPYAQYSDRVTLVGLNQYFYAPRLPTSGLRFDAFFSYPFRHSLLEPMLFARAPLIEVEIMSGISNAAHCDIVIPNGIPAEAFLREHFSKVVVLLPPRRRFKGAQGDGLKYMDGVGRFVVSAGKDFDKRASLDVHEFAARIARFVESAGDLAWVFVGGSADFAAHVSQTYPDLSKARKLICVPFEPDLPALFGRAELYVQPPIVGGGRSPAIAIENGCPALSMQFGDCTRYLPLMCQAKGFDELMSMVNSILADDSSRARTMEACMTVIAPSINEEAAITFESAVRRARLKSAARLHSGAGPDAGNAPQGIPQ